MNSTIFPTKLSSDTMAMHPGKSYTGTISYVLPSITYLVYAFGTSIVSSFRTLYCLKENSSITFTILSPFLIYVFPVIDICSMISESSMSAIALIGSL